MDGEFACTEGFIFSEMSCQERRVAGGKEMHILEDKEHRVKNLNRLRKMTVGVRERGKISLEERIE